MKRRKAVLPAVLAAGVLLGGCSSALISIGNTTDTSLECTFMKKSGLQTQTILIPEGETTTVRFEYKLDEGSIDFRLTDADEKEYFTRTAEQDGSESIELEASGKYKVAINCHNASGSYLVSWGDAPESSGEAVS